MLVTVGVGPCAQIQLLAQSRKPVFSSLTEQDSGLVTAGNAPGNASHSVSEDDRKTDLYRAVYDERSVAGLMERGIEEYNKGNPRIKLALYRVSTTSLWDEGKAMRQREDEGNRRIKLALYRVSTTSLWDEGVATRQREDEGN